MPKTNVNGAWEENNVPKYPIDGAFTELPCAKAYLDGAWQEIWSATKYFELVGTSSYVSQSGNGAGFTPNRRATVDFQLDKAFNTPTMSITYEGGSYVYNDETGTGTWSYAGDIKIIGVDADGNEVEIQTIIVGADTAYQDAKTSSFTFSEGTYESIVIRLQSYGYGSQNDSIYFSDVTINNEIYAVLIEK